MERTKRVWVRVSFPVCWHLTAAPWTCITQSYLSGYKVQCLHAYSGHGKAKEDSYFCDKERKVK